MPSSLQVAPLLDVLCETTNLEDKDHHQDQVLCALDVDAFSILEAMEFVFLLHLLYSIYRYDRDAILLNQTLAHQD